MDKKWWQKAVVYQVWPKSFKDSNGDGIGDINGIIEKLDYLKELGINVIWLSPVYKSPMDDNGYDISDYQDIAPEFGTIGDMERLINEAGKRSIKIVMDLVVNHTSDEHPWFIESKKSKDSKKRDWYIWKDAKPNGKRPNNWKSFFSRYAWEYDEKTKQYYLHLFSIKQPDLNWENPEVRNAVYDMMKWWLDKGIGGFRMDVINNISKDQRFPDSEDIDGLSGWEYWANGPRVHEFIQEMNREVLSKYDIMTVGETGFVNVEHGKLYTAPERKELNMIFQFEHMSIDGEDSKWDVKPFDLVELKEIMAKWQDELYNKGWNSLYWNNHDQPRVVSRFGNDKEYRTQSAKMLATCLHFMYGTPYIYQGEEIGMTNVSFDSINDYNDLEIHHFYDVATNDKKMPENKVMEAIHKVSRDNARTPVQWNDKENAGFTTGRPWIKVNSNYKNINVEKALKDENSIFFHYKKLIALRRDSEYSDIIVFGSHKLLLEKDKEIYAYTRQLNGEMLLIICNFYDGTPIFKLPEDLQYSQARVLISNYDNTYEKPDKIKLRPYESIVYHLK